MPPDFVYELPPAAMFLAVLGITGLVALGFHLLFAHSALRRIGERLADLSPVVMTLCGTLFVLSVTFLANAVWQAEDRARETVNAEARNLRVIETYMDAMTAPSREPLARIIASYGEAVASEWNTMSGPAGRAAAEQRLNEVYAATIAGFSEGDLNRLLQQRILTALDQLSAARQQRLSMAQDVVSAGQWFLVISLGLLLMAVIAIGHGRFPFSRAVALSAVTLAISIAAYVILAHDRPFVGYHAVSPQQIIAAAGVAN
jgi:hypothetical protein